MSKIEWVLEPILVPIGTAIMEFDARHNTRVWEWARRNPEATDDEMMRRIYWGVPVPHCNTLHQHALDFAKAQYIENDHTSQQIVRWYQVKYLVREILKYHFSKK